MLNAILAAALLYPTVVKTGRNLFREDGWRSRSDAQSERPIHAWAKEKGGPFSPDEPAWKTESFVPESSFWRQDVRLQKGHRYLVGMWFRSANARAIMWCWSKTVGGTPFNERFYLYGGFNSCLAPYICDEVKERLGCGAEKWKLLYRPLEVGEELAGAVQFKFGIYMSTGSLTFSHPFLIDITGSQDASLTAEIAGGKPVKALSLQQVGLRDTIWTKSFDPAVPAFEGVLAEEVNMLRGFDQNKVNGHVLVVKYADGTVENVSAPQENSFRYR